MPPDAAPPGKGQEIAAIFLQAPAKDLFLFCGFLLHYCSKLVI
jgi:hypothetical protein